MKPLDPSKDLKEDGTAKYRLKTKLMLRLEQMEMNDECSDELLDNSFQEMQSEEESSSEEEEEDDEADNDSMGEIEEEDETESPLSPVKRKKRPLVIKNLAEEGHMRNYALLVKRDNTQNEEEVPEVEEKKVKKFRKNVMNVHCTEYDVIPRVAKKLLGYRIKEYEEDHEGGVLNGEGNQKLSEDWDVSWHDLGITADFLTKM